MTSNIAPDLRKVFLLDVRLDADRLVLRVGGVRRAGLLLTGDVVFGGAPGPTLRRWFGFYPLPGDLKA